MPTPTDGDAHEGTGPLHAALTGDHTSALGALLEAIGVPGPHHPATCSVPPDPRTHVVLTTNDGATFHPDRGFITEHSGLIRDLLADADGEKEAVPLPNVAARELSHMLWLLQQGFKVTQLERCIAAFDIESVVALQQAANFMDVRCITAACAGVIAQCVQKAADGKEKGQLLELVTLPRLPQELCELWMEHYNTKADELLGILAKHPNQLLWPLAQWDGAWTESGVFSDHRFSLSDATDSALLRARSDVVKNMDGASPMFVHLCKKVCDADLPFFAHMPMVSSLNLLGCNKITDAGLLNLRELSHLTSLELGCDITDVGLKHITRLTGLTSLNLTGCRRIRCSGVALIKTLHQLKSLNLMNCFNIPDEALAHVKELTQLTSLDLRRCRQFTDLGFAHIEGLTSLRALDVEDCRRVNDAALSHMVGWTQLTSLNLLGCWDITNAGLASISVLRQLTELNVSYCNELTDEGIFYLKTLTRLTSLNLGNCYQITDTSIAHIQQLTQLTSLSVASCDQVTDTGLGHLVVLVKLATLDLSFCKLITGAGLKQLAVLPSLQLLKVTYCRQIRNSDTEEIRQLLPHCQVC